MVTVDKQVVRGLRLVHTPLELTCRLSSHRIRCRLLKISESPVKENLVLFKNFEVSCNPIIANFPA